MRKWQTKPVPDNCNNCQECREEMFYGTINTFQVPSYRRFCDLKDRKIKRVIKCKNWRELDILKEIK